MASLNGAVIGPPVILITLRVACGVGCENAPRTVRIPATARTAVRKPMRRFMISSIRMACPIRRASVIPNSLFGKHPWHKRNSSLTRSRELGVPIGIGLLLGGVVVYKNRYGSRILQELAGLIWKRMDQP